MDILSLGRADYYLLLPAPQAGCRQGAAVGAINRPLQGFRTIYASGSLGAYWVQ
ncbi:MAG: hypothetical protein ACR2H5_23765 [Ktedonobacteraceae bacterium]